MTAGSGQRRDGVRLRRDLRAMLGDGCAFSLMVGMGETYVAPFALALGFSDVAAGLIATVPMLTGGVLQLATPAAVGWLGSHKRWVVLCALLQAATFIPLASGALSGEMSGVALFLATSLYWGLGMATSPAWNTWAGRTVPRPLRTAYFARRALWCNVALLAGLGLGAALLRQGDPEASSLDAYAWVFAAALSARVVSASFLARQSEARPVPIGETRISPRAIREHLRTGGHGRLLAYLLLFQLSVWMAAPFFTPYMLGPLHLDYAAFAALTGVAFAARIAALPLLARFAHAAGTRRLLWLGSSGIVSLPLLWLASDAFAWLLALQVFAGASWAAYELAALLSFFEHIPQHSRTSVLCVYNLANAAAIATGSLVGALALGWLGEAPSAYAAVFVVSTGARLVSLLMLRGAPDVHPKGTRPPPLRTLGLRPSAGGLQRPVLAGLEEDEDPGSP